LSELSVAVDGEFVYLRKKVPDESRSATLRREEGLVTGAL